MDIINLVIVFLLIAFTGFFVAAEFAIVKVRSSRIDQLVSEGKRGALAAKELITHLDEYLSACQLGITLTSLGLGWVGEPTVHHILQPIFSNLNLSEVVANTLSFIIAFAIITFLHVVVGELAPKTFAIQKAEQVSLIFARPLIYFYKIAYPFIWVLNGSARGLTKLFGLKSANEHGEVLSEEELRMVLSESFESGKINQSEYDYVENIFEFDNRIAKEIMIPRTEIVGLYANDTLESQLNTISKERYTRYPVFGRDKDKVIGMINVKDLFIHSLKNKKDIISLEGLIRPIIEVIETIPIYDLLLIMQQNRGAFAVLYDEYGGTAGIVTLEDILEEIVGEIRDEYDEDEKSPIQHLGEKHILVNGKVLISEINTLLGLEINNDSVDTIGGWILTKNPSIKTGQQLELDGYTIKICSKDSFQILSVEIKQNDPDSSKSQHSNS